MAQTQILIIDDEADVCTFFSRLLSRSGYQVTTARNQAEATQALSAGLYSVALVDLKLPDTDGLSLLQQIKGRQPACEVIIMTGFSTIKTAVTAIQLGAYEYVEKPFEEIAEIERLVARAVAHGQVGEPGAAREEWAETARAVGFQVGSSPVMRKLVSLAYKIANKNINVLIQGKTGTGKEVLARFIHAASNRENQPFIPVNCGALPETLLESELFGHERGAFTGASSARRGIFELANRGTLFLDEIGDASAQIQVKLLRVLETGEIVRVGSEATRRTNVRLLAATNVDLEEAIRARTFREDLYYRLNVVRLEIPPLHAHREDIPQLAEHFVRQINPEIGIAPATLRLLCDAPWPGNIRQLANAMRRAMVLCNGATILPRHLGDLLDAPTAAAAAGQAEPLRYPEPAAAAGAEPSWDALASWERLEQLDAAGLTQTWQTLQNLEKRVATVMSRKGLAPPSPQELKASELETIRRALEQHRWNITEAARALGIARNTLHRKINKYGLRDR